MNPSTDPHQDKTVDYVQQISGCQSQVYGYIYSLLGDADIAWDTLQETNAVLWKKRDEFDASRPFMPWACGIAFQQVLPYVAKEKDRKATYNFYEDFAKLFPTSTVSSRLSTAKKFPR